MNFSRGFTQIEFFFMISFVLIYIVYFYRVFSAAKKLKTSATSSIFKFIIRAIYLGLLSLALLGPNFGTTEMEARASGKDIFLVFDLSESMNANDVEPTRLDKAKSEALNLIERFKSDRIGIIVFNSEAYIYAPLTFDQENIKSSIQNLKTSILQSGSTNYNPVFQLLNEKMGTGSKNRGKIAVIITDGENHFSSSSEEITKLKKNKINVSFLGVGTLNGGKIPKMGGYKKDVNGEEVVTSLDIDQLNSFSKAVGGSYFILNNLQNDAPKIVEKIALVVNSSDDINRQTVTYNKYVFFLLLALVFIGIDFLITVKVLKI